MGTCIHKSGSLRKTSPSIRTWQWTEFVSLFLVYPEVMKLNFASKFLAQCSWFLSVGCCRVSSKTVLLDIVSKFSTFASPPRPVSHKFFGQRNDCAKKFVEGWANQLAQIWPFQCSPKPLRVSPLPTEMLISERSVHCTRYAK